MRDLENRIVAKVNQLIFIYCCSILLFSFGCDNANGPETENFYNKFVIVSDIDSPNKNFSDIYVMNTNGELTAKLTNTIYYETDPCVSPDKDKIVFVSYRNGNPDIYLMNIDGSGQINISNDPEPDMAPVFTPDGKSIVFKSFRTGVFQIFKTDLNGNNTINLTSDNYFNHDPKVTQQNTIVYLSHRNGTVQLVKMDIDAKNATTITGTNLYVNDGFDISKDGSLITFQGSDLDDNSSSIYIIKIDGSGLKKLIDDLDGSMHPRFSPIDTKIVFDKGWNKPDELKQIAIIDYVTMESKDLIEMKRASFPIFYNNGKDIIFTAEPKGVIDIILYDLINGTNKMITDSKSNYYKPNEL